MYHPILKYLSKRTGRSWMTPTSKRQWTKWTVICMILIGLQTDSIERLGPVLERSLVSVLTTSVFIPELSTALDTSSKAICHESHKSSWANPTKAQETYCRDAKDLDFLYKIAQWLNCKSNHCWPMDKAAQIGVPTSFASEDLTGPSWLTTDIAWGHQWNIWVWSTSNNPLHLIFNSSLWPCWIWTWKVIRWWDEWA